MTIDEILINAGPGETRIAFLSGGRLLDLDISRPGQATAVGDIHLGRVEKTLPGIAAAFVDVGLDRSGFLGLAEARPPGTRVEGDERAAQRITDYVSEGDFVIVQIDRPSVADKGPKLTTHVSFTGHSLVYLPEETGLRLSRRIEDVEERARLTRLLGDVAGEEGGGFILRTAAVGASAETLARELAELRRAWEEVLDARREARRPGRLRTVIDPVLGALRDAGGSALRRVLVDDAETLSRLRAYCEAVVPPLADRLQAYREPAPIFEAFAIEEQIEGALRPRVDLPSGGGNLLIQETPMLVVIDVNSAGRSEGGPEETALRTDLEAADEIARQMRLRELAGAIVIDFVPLRRSVHRAQLVERLRAAVATDRVAVNVFGHTRLGLVEMTRPRLRATLADRLAAPCPTCDGVGRVPSAYTTAMAALRAARHQGRGLRGAGDGEIAAAPPVVEILETEAAGAKAEAESRLGRRLRLRPDPTLAPDRFAVTFDGGEGSG